MIIEARDDVVSLSGSLDKNQWAAIQAAANLLLRLHPNGILIDASEITRCSDAGARTFLDAMEYIERHHARIVVCHPPVSVLETLKHVPGVRSQLAIAETCEAGRASLELASSTRRKTHGPASDGTTATMRPRLVMIPLVGEIASLEETIALALQMGAVDDASQDDAGDEKAAAPLPGASGERRRKVAPLLHFLYVLEIPRSMPINSPMAEEEGCAKAALAQIAEFAESAGLVTQTSVARARDAGDEIAEQAANLGAEILILSLPPRSSPERDAAQPIVETVIHRARCELIIKTWQP